MKSSPKGAEDNQQANDTMFMTWACMLLISYRSNIAVGDAEV